MSLLEEYKMKALLILAFLINPTVSLAGTSQNISITKLTGKDVTFLTDGRGHFILIPKVSVATQDGRETSSSENVFFGTIEKMLNAESVGFSSSSLDNPFTSFSFKDGGELRLDYKNSGMLKLATLSCDGNKIPLRAGRNADRFARETKLELYPARSIQQIYKFPEGKYLVVESPIQGVTPESYRFWIGTPGEMKMLETYYNTSYGKFKKFKGSSEVSDNSTLEDPSGHYPAKWTDGRTRESIVIERLKKYYPEVVSANDQPIPSLEELKIPGLTNYDDETNSICAYFKN